MFHDDADRNRKLLEQLMKRQKASEQRHTQNMRDNDQRHENSEREIAALKQQSDVQCTRIAVLEKDKSDLGKEKKDLQNKVDPVESVNQALSTKLQDALDQQKKLNNQIIQL